MIIIFNIYIFFCAWGGVYDEVGSKRPALVCVLFESENAVAANAPIDTPAFVIC